MTKSNITTTTKYSGPEKKKINDIYKSLKIAEYIGEDGYMCCIAKDEKAALARFKRRVRQDCGKEDAAEMKLEEVGIGFLFLVDPEREDHKHMVGESEWYVNWSGNELSDYQVFVYYY